MKVSPRTAAAFAKTLDAVRKDGALNTGLMGRLLNGYEVRWNGAKDDRRTGLRGTYDKTPLVADKLVAGPFSEVAHLLAAFKDVVNETDDAASMRQLANDAMKVLGKLDLDPREVNLPERISKDMTAIVDQRLAALEAQATLKTMTEQRDSSGMAGAPKHDALGPRERHDTEAAREVAGQAANLYGGKDVD